MQLVDAHGNAAPLAGAKLRWRLAPAQGAEGERAAGGVDLGPACTPCHSSTAARPPMSGTLGDKKAHQQRSETQNAYPYYHHPHPGNGEAPALECEGGGAEQKTDERGRAYFGDVLVAAGTGRVVRRASLLGATAHMERAQAPNQEAAALHEVCTLLSARQSMATPVCSCSRHVRTHPHSTPAGARLSGQRP